jgi:ABC-type glutathione transport system ATPase component
VHTSAWIVSKCLKSDLVRGRTVLLITHNVALVTPVADYVVSLGSDGRVIATGSPSETVLKDRELMEQIAHEQEALELDTDLEEDEQDDDSKAVAKGSKLVIAEEVQQGHVSGRAMKLFANSVSGWPVVGWTVYLLLQRSAGSIWCHTLYMTNYLLSLSKGSEVAKTWWLGQWADAYSEQAQVDAV